MSERGRVEPPARPPADDLDWVPPERSRPGVAASPVEAPMTARGRAGRLPVPVTPLIGREMQLARLEQVLDGHRAVTLTGPAGAGKTRERAKARPSHKYFGHLGERAARHRRA